uniref:BPTI/Kunitz inhibitor domain-containing protein n=1 Tax=Ixodes ricinus TaxID=34613 RepID=V5HD96_IXORI
MQTNIPWIFVVAAFGVCNCDERTYQDSGEDSSSMTQESRCDGPPDTSRGWALARGWFYVPESRDQCRLFLLYLVFYILYSIRKTKFRTVTECRRICRGTVPLDCFQNPPQTKRTWGLPVMTYNLTQGACIEIAVRAGQHGPNIFKSEKECISECRDPEYGQCAPSAVVNCDRSTGYRYNVDARTCENAPEHKCGPFATLEDCYERCARYIRNKCHIPFLTSKYCDIKEARYWYNWQSKQCEQFLGCSDDDTNFPTAKECWETCSSKEESRCLQPPDLGKLRLGRRRYYYNITANACQRTTQFAIWQNTQKKNNFESVTDCENACMPKHKDVKK